MTKLIAAAIIILVLYGGVQLFFYWEKVRDEEKIAQKQAASSTVDPHSLPGMPQQMENALTAAQNQGAAGLRTFLKANARILQDPRKAWIELDYCLALSREDPSEAKRLFAEVKGRTPPSSPVWPRIKQLEKTYE
jgi:hypothetical protein